MSFEASGYEIPPTPDSEDEADWLAWIAAMPVTQALGLRPVSVSAQLGVMELAEPPIRNSRGWVHGGLLLACADQCIGTTGMRAVAGGEQMRTHTATLTSHFVRPAIPTVRFEARITRAGRTMVFAELTATARDDRTCFTATATLGVVPRSENS